MNKKAVATLLTALILLVMSSSGCINAYLTKDAIDPGEGKTEYRVNEKVVMKHYFDTVMLDASTWENHTTNTTYIKDATEYIVVNIEVTLDDVSILPLPIPIEDLPMPARYVQVIITMPDGLTWFDKTYNVTEKEHLEVLSPMEGEWVFQVNALGYGTYLIPYYDSYQVFVNVKEPVKVK